MGGLVGGLFDLFSGDPTQRQENALNSLYGYELPKGENSLNQGLGFYSDILSGDPAKIAEALAPEIKAGQQQVQQQAEQNAMFGNRGGGANSATNAAQSGERGNIINLIGGLQQGSAGALTGAGENLLNMGSGNVMNSADLALKNRQRQVGDVSGIAQGAAQIAAPFMGGSTAVPTTLSSPQLTSLGPEIGEAPSNFNAAGIPGLEQAPDLSIFDTIQQPSVLAG